MIHGIMAGGLIASGPVPSSDTSATLIGASNSGIRRAIAVHVWRNVDQTTPLDVATTTATGIDTGQANPPSITPTTSGAVIVGVGVGSAGATPPAFTSSDLTDHFLSTGTPTASTACVIGMGAVAWAGGPFNPAQFGGGGTGTGSAWTAAAMALRPDGALTYVGGRVIDGPSGSASNFAVDLTVLTGGIDTAPAVGDIIIIAYGLTQTTGSDAPSIVSPTYNEVANLLGDDNVNARMSLNWKLAA